MNILVCTYSLPFVFICGQFLRIYNIFKLLSEQHKIFLIALTDPHGNSRFIRELRESGIFSQICHREIKRKSLGYLVNLVMTQYSADLEFPMFKKQLHNLVLETIEQRKIDLMHVNGFPATLLLADLNAIPKVLDLCDSPTLAHEREFKNADNHGRRITAFLKYMRARKNEKYLARSYDFTTLVSPADATFTRELCPTVALQVIPNGIDTTYFAPNPSVPEEFPSIIFFGTMNFPPNIDAAIYLYRDILPEVRKEFPTVHLYLAGRHPAKDVFRLHQDGKVTVTGMVADIRPFIMKASIVVIPMRIGSGFKNKILEAMALGKPVVSTSVGIEALDEDCKQNIPVGDTPKGLAREITTLLRDKELRRKMGNRGPEIVRRSYTWERCAQRYEELYQRILEER